MSFHSSATQAQRQYAIELARGQVVGGDRVGDEDGDYFVYLGHSVGFDSLRAALVRVSALPYVIYASPELLLDASPPY